MGFGGWGVGVIGRRRVDLFSKNKKTIARSSERSASDEDDGGFAVIFGQGGNIGRFNGFGLCDGISVTNGIVVDID